MPSSTESTPDAARFPLPPPLPVDEVERIDPDRFRAEYVERHRPLIVRGAAAEWPAMQWTDARLRETLGAMPLRVDVVPHDAEGRLLLDATEQISMTAAELVERFADTPDAHHYVHDLNLPPPLYPDIGDHGLSAVFPVLRRHTLWWGQDGQVSTLHYDDNENLMCQIAGSKTFLLFDVCDLPAMYARPGDFRSDVDLARPDPDAFPRLADATPYVARIEAGDMLYVPCYWWHHVTSYGRNIAVSHIINETMAQRVRVTGRLVEAGALPVDDATRDALLEIVRADERPGRRNRRLKAFHRDYVAEHGRSYYPHVIFERLVEESLVDILRGHAAY